MAEILSPATPLVTLPVGMTLREFFSNTHEIYLCPHFLRHFDAFLDQPTRDVSLDGIVYHDLINPTDDYQIKEAFKKRKIKFVFNDPAFFLQVFAELTKLNATHKTPFVPFFDGKTNLWYVKVKRKIIVVHVYCGVVHACFRRGDIRWDAGFRVFRSLPANASVEWQAGQLTPVV